MKLKRDPHYFYLGVTLVCVMGIGIILRVIFTNFPGFFSVIKKLLAILSPVLYGLAFAYLLNPVMVFVDKNMQKLLRKWKFSEKNVRSLSRAVGVIAAVVLAILIIYGFFAMLLPNLIESISGIVSQMPAYYSTAQTWVQNLAEKYPDYSDFINQFFEKVYNAVANWFQGKVLGNMENLVVNVTTQVYAVVKNLMNILIGLVAAVYMLLSKEKFLAQTKKIIVAVMKRDRADRFLEVCRRTNRVFSGFINGKILDSAIIGVLCYIGMSILRLPFPALVSTIVGVTNVIPFFGPIIGAVPSAMLIVLVNPLQALYFLIFVMILQQVDGNLIGPYILGDAVGLPSFWILVSITLFGSLFGFVGMLFGVPVFAVIYMLIRDNVNRKLEAKGAPVSTAYYYHMQKTADLESVPEDPKESSEEGTEAEKKAAEKEFWK